MFCMLSSFNDGKDTFFARLLIWDYWKFHLNYYIFFIIIAVAVQISLFYRTICTTVKVWGDSNLATGLLKDTARNIQLCMFSQYLLILSQSN